MSVAAAAFSLGISNMRRRKARTVLTCITLILLTFTVLSFTSIVPVLRFNKVPSKRDADTHVYDGIMIRTAMWDPLQEIAYRHIKDEFGNRGRKGRVYPVAPRAWFYGTLLGEQSFLTLRKGDNSYDAKAAVGMVPDEAEIMDLETTNRKAFLAGDWFGYKNGKRVCDKVDPYSIIIRMLLPTKLGIQAERRRQSADRVRRREIHRHRNYQERCVQEDQGPGQRAADSRRLHFDEQADPAAGQFAVTPGSVNTRTTSLLTRS